MTDSYLASEPTVHPKAWGVEIWIVNNDKYCGKILRISEGWQCSLHYHLVKHETFFVSAGLLRIEVGDEKFYAGRGRVVEIPTGVKHRFAAQIDSEILEFSTHHDDDDVVRLELSRRI